MYFSFNLLQQLLLVIIHCSLSTLIKRVQMHHAGVFGPLMEVTRGLICFCSTKCTVNLYVHIHEV